MLLVIKRERPAGPDVDSEGCALQPRVLPVRGKQAGLYRVNARSFGAVCHFYFFDTRSVFMGFSFACLRRWYAMCRV